MEEPKYLRIKLIEKAAPFDPPAVVLFPSGIPKGVTKDDSMVFKYLKNVDPERVTAGKIVAETEQCLFVGSNSDEDSLFPTKRKYFVGVRKREGAVIRIASTQLFTMKEVNLRENQDVKESVTCVSDFHKVRSELTERFGSVRKRRELRTYEAGKFNVEDNPSSALSVQNAMDAAAEATEMNDEALDSASLRPLLPPHDSLAADPRLIYSFSNIIPMEFWPSLSSKKLINPTESAALLAELYPTFVVEKLTALAKMTGEAQKEQARMLMALTYLMRLLIQKRMPNVSDAIGCESEFAEYLSITFGHVRNGFTSLFKSGKAKLITHICILALLIKPDAELTGAELQSLAANMQITVSDLVRYLREVGCVGAKKDRAALRAPLQLPDLAPFRKRGR